MLSCPGGVHPNLRIDRHSESLGCRCRHAGQAQQRRVCHGLLKRNEPLRSRHQPVAAQGIQCRAGAGRLIGRFLRFGCRRSLPGRDRHRHGRLHSPAGRDHGNGRHQAHLRPLLPLGHRRLRLLAGSGGADRQDGTRCRHHASTHVEHRSEGFHQRRLARAGLRSRGRRERERASGLAYLANTAWTACPRRSTTSGSRASPG